MHLDGELIYDGTDPLVIPYESVGGRIQAAFAPSVSAPHLKKAAGGINAPEATRFDAPELVSIGNPGLHIPSATAATIPKLKTTGRISGNQIRKFNAPNLTSTGELYLPRVTEFSAPELQTLQGSLSAISLLRFYAPKLTIVKGDMLLLSAKELSTQSLKTIAGALQGQEITEAYLPKLKSVGGINLPKIAPKLPKLEELRPAYGLNRRIITKHGDFSFSEWNQKAREERVRKILREKGEITL